MTRKFACKVCGRNAHFLEDDEEYCGYHRPSRYVGRDPIPVNYLLRYRLRARMTQSALSKAADVSQPTIVAIEKGFQSPYPLTCVKLADALGQPAETVFPMLEGKI